MTKAIKASDHGLKPHWKVRIVLPGAILHAASWTEPKVPEHDAPNVHAQWINDHNYGDTIGYIDWNAVAAITWRYSA